MSVVVTLLLSYKEAFVYTDHLQDEEHRGEPFPRTDPPIQYNISLTKSAQDFSSPLFRIWLIFTGSMCVYLLLLINYRLTLMHHESPSVPGHLGPLRTTRSGDATAAQNCGLKV